MCAHNKFKLNKSARTAYTVPSFDGHQAMPAIVVQDHAIYHTQSTPLARRGGGEKISSSMQTEKVVMVEISTQNMVVRRASLCGYWYVVLKPGRAEFTTTLLEGIIS
jgi:hypothetical protein